MNKTIKEFLNGDTYSIRYAFDGDIAYECNEEVRKYMRNQSKEIEKLHSIIKEVREVIETCKEYTNMNYLLEILDKVEENTNGKV